MEKIRALIVDDEPLAREGIRMRLEQEPDVKVIGACKNGREAVAAILRDIPDLVFLDIQMPRLDGFGVIEAVGVKRMPHVIFVTAYDEHALRAFEVSALDYLLKPIQTHRLAETVRKILNKEEKQDKKTELPQLSDNDQVFVKDGEKCWFVKLSDIRLFESEGNYVRVYFDKNKPLILKSLNNLDERLSPRTFFRASRKHIINLKWVESIENWFNGGLMVKLRGGEQVEISRRQAAKLKDMMSL